MMRKVMITFCLCVMSTLYAQEKDKVIFGGTISADLGRFNDRFEITPTLHKKIVSKFYLGLGATLAHYKQESIGFIINDQSTNVVEYDIKTRTTYYGVNLFVRFFPFENRKQFYKNFYLQSELEYLKGNGKYNDINGSYTFKTDNKTIFTGVGYKQLIGRKFALNANLLFKLNNETDSPYRNPIIRIGFEF